MDRWNARRKIAGSGVRKIGEAGAVATGGYAPGVMGYWKSMSTWSVSARQPARAYRKCRRWRGVTTVVAWSGEAVVGGAARGGGAAGHAELAVDGAQVRADRVPADEQARGNRGIGQACGHQP